MSPKSKHHPRTSKARHKLPRPAIRIIENQKFRISKKKFLEVRDDPDFITLIQVGRIINALSFGIDLLENIKNDDLAVSRRYGARTFFINAAYLHESLKVLYSLRPKYR